MVYWTYVINIKEGLMKTKHLVMSALMTALLAATGSSFAQDRDHGRDDHYGQRDHDDRHDDRRGDDHRGDDRRGGDHHWDGAGPNHDLRRGGRLPANYRNRQYVVNDYRSHNLRPPPRGYHWVQTGGDYVLAAIATGVITDLIINSR
jgi:Ni/Co efflux regulator RcnB